MTSRPVSGQGDDDAPRMDAGWLRRRPGNRIGVRDVKIALQRYAALVRAAHRARVPF